MNCTETIVNNSQKQDTFVHSDISSESDISISLSDMYQLDGNNSMREEKIYFEHFNIPVFVSKFRGEPCLKEKRIPVRRSIKRNNLILQSIALPTVMNINPRSIYNKCDELPLLLEQYEADIVCMSETWERESYTLEEMLNLPN